MRKIRLGRTGLCVSANGFGALPIQRTGMDEAVRILRKARDRGIDYFDTARYYTDSEEKLGRAFSGARDSVVLATKTFAKTGSELEKDLNTSLELLGTDHVDVYQFHNPPFLPVPGGEDGLYDAALRAREQGKIRFIGITNHRLALAVDAIRSGLYDVLQFPISYLSTEEELAVPQMAYDADIGMVAMKGLSGGLITSSETAAAFMARYPGLLPVWGIQHEWELDEFLRFTDDVPLLTEEMKARIDRDRRELAGDFCRGCGYCMAGCPAKIDIANCARISLLMRRGPVEFHLTGEWRNKIEKVKDCIDCGQCRAKCPYGLDTPALLRRNYQDYHTFID